MIQVSAITGVLISLLQGVSKCCSHIAGDRGGGLPAQLRSLHRAQPAGGGAGSTAAGLSLVELSGVRAGRGERAAGGESVVPGTVRRAVATAGVVAGVSAGRGRAGGGDPAGGLGGGRGGVWAADAAGGGSAGAAGGGRPSGAVGRIMTQGEEGVRDT
jgi:hypothetical protein